MASVISYFILNIAFTIWLWLVEAGQVFEGGTDGGEKVSFYCVYAYIYIQYIYICVCQEP